MQIPRHSDFYLFKCRLIALPRLLATRAYMFATPSVLAWILPGQYYEADSARDE